MRYFSSIAVQLGWRFADCGRLVQAMWLADVVVGQPLRESLLTKGFWLCRNGATFSLTATEIPGIRPGRCREVRRDVGLNGTKFSINA